MKVCIICGPSDILWGSQVVKTIDFDSIMRGFKSHPYNQTTVMWCVQFLCSYFWGHMPPEAFPIVLIFNIYIINVIKE